jgi:WD40 repeat protein
MKPLGSIRFHACACAVACAFAMLQLLPACPAGCSQPAEIPKWFPSHVAILADKNEGVGRPPVFSSDSRSLAGSDWKTVFVWNVASRKLEASLKPKTRWLPSMAFVSNAETIITATDKTIKIWDVRRETVRSELKGHADNVRKIAVAPDENTLLSTDWETVKLWDLKNGIELRSVPLKKDAMFNGLVFSPDGKTVAVAGGSSRVPSWGEVRILDVPDLRTRRVFGDFEVPPPSIAISADSKLLLAAGYSGRVDLWELSSGKPLATWMSGIANIDCVAFAPGGDMLVTSGSQPNPANFFMPLGEARFWKVTNGNVETGKPVAIITDEGSMDHIAISPDGKYCATAGRDCALRLWSLKGEPSGKRRD